MSIDLMEVMFQGFTEMFNILDSVPVVKGISVSVLDFLIACGVISVMLPVLLTIGETRFNSSYKAIKYENRRGRREE